MANSKFEYVRCFEQDESLLPNTWIVVRVDGRGFHKLSHQYRFTKPNDVRALSLMNTAARSVFGSVPDLCIAYGVSDEYSFVFHKSTSLFERRRSKLVSTVVSTFTAAYVFHWRECFGDEEGDQPLSPEWLPSFDGRAVMYPTLANLRDYMSWRQVDCHINNLYNTTFWALVQQGGKSTQEAEDILKGTFAADKNEILFSRFGINYNNEQEIFKKGSVVFREYTLERHTADATSGHPFPAGGSALDLGDENRTSEVSVVEPAASRAQEEKQKKARQKAQIVVRHLDIIKDEFWDQRPWILSGRPGRPVAIDTP